jgi:F-box protein 9
MKELIASFSGLAIEPAAPPIEGMPQPPCPIAELPDEILIHILRDVAILDVADFVRLARVCKRFAYLVATEDQIWRRVCLGSEFGFAGMHYRWQMGITWGTLEPEMDDEEYGEVVEIIDEDEEALDTSAIMVDSSRKEHRMRVDSTAASYSLFATAYSSSWQRMFRQRPRLRFGGCYISTVNYIRPGQASSMQPTWTNPVHIVTYYRYLRFFRDGSVLSLLTTTEPTDVVHHLTRDTFALHTDGAMQHLPSAVIRQALRGRWRLSGGDEEEGDVCVETEGATGSKYTYQIDLSMRSAGKGARNNKLVWRGFYSHNRLTDDWGEFTLKHDKPFFFSRVRSYGLGY